jgi:hypothetical protein
MHKGLEVSGNMADLETNKSFAWMEWTFKMEGMVGRSYARFEDLLNI